jgi:uncharacterized repeat protein (TIGR01451 family)
MRYLICYSLLFALLGFSASGHAACRAEACVSMGSNLASIDSNQSELLSGVLSGLTGSRIDLSTNELNALAQGDVQLDALLSNVQELVGANDTATALTSEITLSELYTAAADAANAAGDAAAATALSDLGAEVSGVTETVQLGELITLQESESGYEGVNINALDIATGGIQLFNGSNAVTTSEPVRISGSALGLGGVVNEIGIRTQVVEQAEIVCGPEGSTFHSASIRVQITLDLVDSALDTSSLLGLPGIAGVEASLGQVKFYIEVSRADGIVQTIDAINQSVTVQATPGISDFYIGEFPEAVFLNTGVPLDPDLLEFANIGSVSVTDPLLGTTTAAIQARSAAQGNAPFTDTLVFNGPFPETQTTSTSADVGSQLIDSLMSNLELRLEPDDLALLNTTLLPLLQTATTDTLAPTLSSVLTAAVDPLLQGLGVAIGEVDVTVYGARQTCDFSGLVYHDKTHDYTYNTGDAVCPEVLYVKLVAASNSAGPALAVAAVDPATGNYTFAGASTGEYILVLDTNNDLSDVFANAPQGWLHTESENGVQTLTVSTAETDAVNFGLFHGSLLSGVVFEDNGAGAALAHDGVLLADEQGIDGVKVELINSGNAQVLATVNTQGGGKYQFWIPDNAGTAPLVVAEINENNYLSVSGDVGNTGGTYDLTLDQIAFVNTSGTRYINVNFGDVQRSALQSDNQRTGVAGTPVFYPHTFISGSAGQIDFVVGSDTPSQADWQSVLYQDSNCDGQLDPAEPVLSEGLTVQAEETVCLVLKTFVPLQAPIDSNHVDTLQATFKHENISIVTEHTVTNVTTVGSVDSPSLVLVKEVGQSTALPGETLVYTIRYENNGAGEVSELKIHDSTPAYTVFASAQCVETQPALTCSVLEQPSAGDSGGITWVVAGVVQPGASGVVQFSVLIQ